MHNQQESLQLVSTFLDVRFPLFIFYFFLYLFLFVIISILKFHWYNESHPFYTPLPYNYKK